MMMGGPDDGHDDAILHQLFMMMILMVLVMLMMGMSTFANSCC